jgi:hypothetical protein
MSKIPWYPSNLNQEYHVEHLDIDADDLIHSFGQGEVYSYRDFHARECAGHVPMHSHATGFDE